MKTKRIEEFEKILLSGMEMFYVDILPSPQAKVG